jgi:hypothetical protein
MVARTTISDYAFEIRGLVAKREYGEAVRRFEACASGLPPHARNELVSRLIRVGGAEAGAALTKTLARAPCYFCRDGQMSCDLCGGAKTFAANGQFCDTCGGHGQIVCTFCGGSGFLAFDSVPTNLAHAVAKQRLDWTARCLREVVRAAAALNRAGEASRKSGELFRLLAAVQRVTAILDEIEPLVLGRLVAGHRVSPGTRSDRLMAECRRLSDRYRRGLAKAIATSCRRRAEREYRGSAQRTAWERQSEFFDAEAARHA